MTGPAPRLLLSVVVIGRNEGARLTRCLESVQRMGPPEPAHDEPGGVEILYVDSRSEDDSCSRAAALGVQALTITAQPTAAHARNTGWRASGGKYILFLDGDTILAPDFVNTSLDEMRREDTIAVVWGHRREIATADSIYNRVLDLDWIYRPGLSAFCGGDALMRRSALEAAGGYDDALPAGEEPDLCRRMRALGWKVLHIDGPMTGHDMNMRRFSQYWRRAVRTGYAFAQLADRYRNTEDPLWADEQKRNVVAGIFWPLSLVAAFLIGLALWWRGSFWFWLPMTAWILFTIAVCYRTARRLRWKNAPPDTLMLAAIHSHLQQVPILLGQVEFARDKAARRGRGIIEYKGVND